MKARWETCLLSLLVVGATVAAGQPCLAQDWKARFEREALEGWRKLHVSLLQTSFCRTNKATGEAMQMKCGKLGRLSHWKDGKGLEIVRAMNPKYQFEIRRTAGSDKWILKDVVVGEPDPVFWEPEQYKRVDHPVWVPGPMRGVAMAAGCVDIWGRGRGMSRTTGIYWTQIEDFTVVAAESEVVDSRDLVRVEATWTCGGVEFNPDGSVKKITEVPDHITLWCDPEHHWAVVQSHRGPLRATTTRVFHFEEASASGLPYLVRETYDWQSVPPGEEKHEEWTYDDSWGRVYPEACFRLSAFGLPEPEGVHWPLVSTAAWIALASLAILAASLGCRGLLRRRSKQARALGGRRGFTLVELLVVIGIIGVLMGMTWPAIQAVRGAAQRTACSNNARQIAVGIGLFESNFGRFPQGCKSDEPAHSRETWLAEILPYVEQQALSDLSAREYESDRSPFNHLAFQIPVPVFGCPSDGRSGSVQWAHQKLLVALTSYVGVAGIDRTQQTGVLVFGRTIRSSMITDGLAATLAFGERPPSPDNWYGWWYAGMGQDESGIPDMIMGVRETNLQVEYAEDCPPGPYRFERGHFGNMCDTFHFWSPHAGGANFAFCDGAVRLLSYDAESILGDLATIAGREVVSLE